MTDLIAQGGESRRPSPHQAIERREQEHPLVGRVRTGQDRAGGSRRHSRPHRATESWGQAVSSGGRVRTGQDWAGGSRRRPRPDRSPERRSRLRPRLRGHCSRVHRARQQRRHPLLNQIAERPGRRRPEYSYRHPYDIELATRNTSSFSIRRRRGEHHRPRPRRGVEGRELPVRERPRRRSR